MKNDALTPVEIALVKALVAAIVRELKNDREVQPVKPAA